MNFKTIAFLLTALLCVFQAQAEKMYAGAFKSANGSAELLVVTERPCSSANPNATLVSEGKKTSGCAVAEAGQIKFQAVASDAIQSYASTDLMLVADVATGDSAAKAANPSGSTHLSCESDDWNFQLDVTRSTSGDLRQLVIEGDTVLSTEKAAQITFNYAGFDLTLNSTTGAFTYEVSGLQSFVTNKVKGNRKSKGAGTCKVAQLKKLF